MKCGTSTADVSLVETMAVAEKSTVAVVADGTKTSTSTAVGVAQKSTVAVVGGTKKRTVVEILQIGQIADDVADLLKTPFSWKGNGGGGNGNGRRERKMRAS
jgi:hypothetical protein